MRGPSPKLAERPLPPGPPVLEGEGKLCDELAEEKEEMERTWVDEDGSFVSRRGGREGGREP